MLERFAFLEPHVMRPAKHPAQISLSIHASEQGRSLPPPAPPASLSLFPGRGIRPADFSTSHPCSLTSVLAGYSRRGLMTKPACSVAVCLVHVAQTCGMVCSSPWKVITPCRYKIRSVLITPSCSTGITIVWTALCSMGTSGSRCWRVGFDCGGAPGWARTICLIKRT